VKPLLMIYIIAVVLSTNPCAAFGDTVPELFKALSNERKELLDDLAENPDYYAQHPQDKEGLERKVKSMETDLIWYNSRMNELGRAAP
jgi:hypothetical protein